MLKQTPTSISLGIVYSNQGPNPPRSGTASKLDLSLHVDVGLFDRELSSLITRCANGFYLVMFTSRKAEEHSNKNNEEEKKVFFLL